MGGSGPGNSIATSGGCRTWAARFKCQWTSCAFGRYEAGFARGRSRLEVCGPSGPMGGNDADCGSSWQTRVRASLRNKHCDKGGFMPRRSGSEGGLGGRPPRSTRPVSSSALVMAGAWLTVKVKVWVAGLPTPLEAVKVREYVPPVPAAGVPLSVAVPLPLSANVTPLGKVPVSLRLACGKAVVVTVKLPAAPTMKVVLLALVMAGAWLTVRVKVWVAGLPTPLEAVKCREYVPPVPAAGVPLSVAVPLPLSANITPLGKAPVSLRLGVGEPVAVTVKLPAAPTVKAALLALVMAGAWLTVRVKVWAVGLPTPLEAVKVRL